MFKKSIDLVNYFSPMIIIALAILTLARTITRYEVESIVKTLQAKDSQHDQTLDAIKKKLGDDEAWQRLEQPLRQSLKRN